MANDHYVPQFYLANFEIPTKPKWIFSYKRNLKPKPMAIRSVACEDNFDLLKTNNPYIGSDFVAKLLKKTEDDAAPIIKRLVSASAFSLTQEEYKALAFFIAYLAQRNPYSRTKISNLYTEFHKAQLRAQA